MPKKPAAASEAARRKEAAYRRAMEAMRQAKKSAPVEPEPDKD